MFHHSGGGGAFRRMIRHSIARCWVKNTAGALSAAMWLRRWWITKMKGVFLFLKPRLNVLLQLMSRDLRKHSLSWGLRDWEFTNITGKTDWNSITHKFSRTTAREAVSQGTTIHFLIHLPFIPLMRLVHNCLVKSSLSQKRSDYQEMQCLDFAQCIQST